MILLHLFKISRIEIDEKKSSQRHSYNVPLNEIENRLTRFRQLFKQSETVGEKHHGIFKAIDFLENGFDHNYNKQMVPKKTTNF